MRASVDHNVGSNKKERLRIQAEGGEVDYPQEGPEAGLYVKVSVPGKSGWQLLQTTRSLGDFQFKRHLTGPVISTPHVFSHRLEGWEVGLMVMSDGVSDGYEDDQELAQEALHEFSKLMDTKVYYSRDGKKQASGPAGQLSKLEEGALSCHLNNNAFHGGSKDNMTSIVAFFRSFRAEDTDDIQEVDPDIYVEGLLPLLELPLSFDEKNNFSALWRTCVRQSSFCSHEADAAGTMDNYLATGTFLQVHYGVYTTGGRKGEKMVLKQFLADGQKELKEHAKIRPVYHEKDWACELKASMKAAEVIVFFSMLMSKEGAKRMVHINLPQVFRSRHKDPTGRQPLALCEPFIEGEYLKFNSNSGWFLNDDPDDPDNTFDFMQALSHFSYHWSDGEVLLCDLQGAVYDSRYVLTDPAIHSKHKGYYGDTDWGLVGQQGFFARHRCSWYCEHLPDGSERQPLWNKPKCVPKKRTMPRTEHSSRSWVAFEERY